MFHKNAFSLAMVPLTTFDRMDIVYGWARVNRIVQPSMTRRSRTRHGNRRRRH